MIQKSYFVTNFTAIKVDNKIMKSFQKKLFTLDILSQIHELDKKHGVQVYAFG